MERYTKLFSLEANLYAEKSPLCIAAGALLQDNTTGKLLIQLKIQNISCKTIKEVVVGYYQKGTSGENIGEKGNFSYVDLHAERDAFFGTQMPIYLSDSNARSFSVWVEKVTFADGSQMDLKLSEEQWIPIPLQNSLVEEIPSVGARQQYLFEAKAKGALSLTKVLDLWLCTCGAINHVSEETCHACGGVFESLQKIDIEELEARAQQREVDKKRVNEAQEKKKQKKIRLTVAAVALVVLIVAGLSYIGMKPYLDAKNLLASGDSYSAYQAFKDLGDYKDSEEMAKEAEMQNYIDQALSGQYGDDMFAYWRSKTENRGGYITESYYRETELIRVLTSKNWYEICVGDTFGRKLSFNSNQKVDSVKIKDFISMEPDKTDSFGYEFDSAGKDSKGVCRIHYENERTGYWICHVEDDLIILRGHFGETVLLLRDQSKWLERWKKCIEFYELN